MAGIMEVEGAFTKGDSGGSDHSTDPRQTHGSDIPEWRGWQQVTRT